MMWRSGQRDLDLGCAYVWASVVAIWFVEWMIINVVRCGIQQQPECKYQTSMYAYVDKLRSVQAAICGNDGNGSMLDSIMALQMDVCMIMYVDAIEAVTICDQRTG